MKQIVKMVVPIETMQGTAFFFFPATHCKYYMHNYKLLTKMTAKALSDSNKVLGCGHWIYNSLIDISKPIIGFEKEQIWA